MNEKDYGPAKRINDSCTGRTITRVEFAGFDDDIVIHFTDGGYVVIETLGAIELRKAELPCNNTE